MIAISCALPAESSGFVARLENRQRTRDGVVHGSLQAYEICLLHTGVGASAAQRRMENFLRTHQPQWLISSGFAGALDRSLAVGDLVVTDDFGFALPATLNVRRGRLATAPAVLDSAAERDALAARTGAIAVDMETEVIATACAARGVPMCSLRAISDTPAAPFPIPAAVLFDLERQRTNYPAFLLHLVAHPQSLPGLIRFSRQISTARNALTVALEALLRDVNFPP